MQVKQAFSLGKIYEDLTLPTCQRVCNTSDVELEGFSLNVFLLPNHTQTTSAEDRTSLCGLGFRALPSFGFKFLHFCPDSQHAPLSIPCSDRLGGLCGEKVCVGGKESLGEEKRRKRRLFFSTEAKGHSLSVGGKDFP